LDGVGAESFKGADGGTVTYEYQEALASSAAGSDPPFVFDYWQGDHPAEIDTGAFDKVTLTLVAFPSADGDPLTVRVQVHFVDGRELDGTYSAPLKTEPGDCPVN
jgi:hypothetical protein